MTDYFKINQAAIDEALECSLESGADFAELYFENTRNSAVESTQGKIVSIGDRWIKGVGLYMLRGTESVYVYSNNIDAGSLLRLSRKAGSLWEAQRNPHRDVSVSKMAPLSDPLSYSVPFSSISFNDKISLINKADKIAYDSSEYITNVIVRYFETEQNVMIANSEGLLAEDSRRTTRLRVIPSLSHRGESYGDFFDYARARGFEAYEDDSLEKQIRERIADMELILFAPPAPGGTYPIVMEGGGTTGTFIHECCGHQFETTSLEDDGMFWDKRGQKIAGDKVTLIDDGTIPGMYGSASFDDEGMPTQRNILIENGIMKGVLADRLGARKLAVPRSASGRRQNYTYAPVSRMSNTFLAAGEDDPEEIIRSVDEGLYVKALGGGYGGDDFSIMTNGSWWIKNGKLDHPVKNAMLLGRGDETIRKIDMVSRDMEFEKGGDFCGAASGFIPVTASGPRIRISEMLIGGQGDE